MLWGLAFDAGQGFGLSSGFPLHIAIKTAPKMATPT